MQVVGEASVVEVVVRARGVIEYCDHGGGVELVVRLWFRVYSGSHLDVRRFAQQRAVLENGELCLSSELEVVAVNGLALVVLRGRVLGTQQQRVKSTCRVHIRHMQAPRRSDESAPG